MTDDQAGGRERDGRAPVDRLEARLGELRADGRAALVAYGVAGFPDLPVSLAGFRAMAEAGADVLEVGPPYSDPLIDGPVIQNAVRAALDRGIRLDDVLAMVGELTASVATPVCTVSPSPTKTTTSARLASVVWKRSTSSRPG